METPVMFVPGFNPKSLSDDELFYKAAELQKKINYATRFTSMGQGSEQMTLMLTMLENERSERMFYEQWKLREKYVSETIETDPDLQAAARNEKEKIQSPERSKARPRIEARRVQPTPHPVLPRPPSLDADEKDKRS